MSIQQALNTVKSFCFLNSGNKQEWSHNGTHYRWNLGREVAPGKPVNGVVRKNQSGNWVLAGSFKISAEGKILRFTGLGKKLQKKFSSIEISIQKNLETV